MAKDTNGEYDLAGMRRAVALALFCFAASHSLPALAQSADSTLPLGSDAAASEIAVVLPPLAMSNDKPFARLFPNLLADLKRYPSRDTAITLGIGGVLSLGTYAVDGHVSDHASAGGTDQMFHVGGMVGGGYIQVGGAVATYAIGRFARSPTLSHLGADLVRAQVFNGLITHGVKFAVRRGRPGDVPGHLPATYSFPSAHASATWTTATVLWRHFGWQAGVPATLVATFASGSRIQQRQHFLTDVMFGAALGVASGRTITVGHGGRKIVAAPLVTPGGGGVVFTVVQR